MALEEYLKFKYPNETHPITDERLKKLGKTLHTIRTNTIRLPSYPFEPSEHMLVNFLPARLGGATYNNGVIGAWFSQAGIDSLLIYKCPITGNYLTYDRVLQNVTVLQKRRVEMDVVIISSQHRDILRDIKVHEDRIVILLLAKRSLEDSNIVAETRAEHVIDFRIQEELDAFKLHYPDVMPEVLKSIKSVKSRISKEFLRCGIGIRKKMSEIVKQINIRNDEIRKLRRIPLQPGFAIAYKTSLKDRGKQPDRDGLLTKVIMDPRMHMIGITFRQDVNDTPAQAIHTAYTAYDQHRFLDEVYAIDDAKNMRDLYSRIANS